VTRSELAGGGVDFNQIRPPGHVSASYGRRLYGLHTILMYNIFYVGFCCEIESFV
nr:hypothetical protein [Tanacetum cinerariifolium]